MKEGEHQHTRLFKEVFKFDHSYKLCKGEYTLSNNIVHLKYDIHDDFSKESEKGFWFFILFCHLFLCQILADAAELLKSIINLGSPILENPPPEVPNPLSTITTAFLPLW